MTMKLLATIIPIALFAATIYAAIAPAVSTLAAFGLGVLALISLHFAAQVDQ